MVINKDYCPSVFKNSLYTFNGMNMHRNEVFIRQFFLICYKYKK